MASPKFDEVYDFRSIEGLEGFLDEYLTYKGPGLDDSERVWVAERFAHAESEVSLQEILRRHPFVSGAWRRLIVRLRDRGDLQAALEAARQALEHVHESGERVTLDHEHIELLKRCGDRLGAARAATQLIRRRPDDWVAHYHLGDLLDDANEPWAARGHLLLACRGTDSGAAPHNTLAVVYIGLGLLTRAAKELESALAIDATLATAQRNLAKVHAARLTSNNSDVTEATVPLTACSHCEAIFVPLEGRPLTCAACGASRAATGLPCDICGSTEGILLIPGMYCPICRVGSITSRDYARL
jgi:tetratricopeptide (TPR) repeat protein